MLGRCWFWDHTAVEPLARDHGLSRATACRYVDEVIAVLADLTSELPAALERAIGDGFPSADSMYGDSDIHLLDYEGRDME